MEVNLVKIDDFKAPEFLDKAATPVAKEIGQGFGDLVYLVFSPIHKARLRKEFEIQEFMETLKANIESIPEEKLVEPSLHIVGPALEASKYYYEEKELRDMFAKLIASSMNSDTQNQVRSSFIEIIKQMEPLDAVVFKDLDEKYYCDEDECPVVKLAFKEEGIPAVYEDVFPLDCLDNDNIGNIETSVSNLKRLGLIQVDYPIDPELIDCNYIFENHKLTKWFQEIFGDNKEFYMIIGNWNITPFGERFANSCLPDE